VPLSAAAGHIYRPSPRGKRVAQAADVLHGADEGFVEIIPVGQSVELLDRQEEMKGFRFLSANPPRFYDACWWCGSRRDASRIRATRCPCGRFRLCEGDFQRAGRLWQIPIFQASTEREIDDAFAHMAQQPPDALTVSAAPYFAAQLNQNRWYSSTLFCAHDVPHSPVSRGRWPHELR
jgi:hypothetical protein